MKRSDRETYREEEHLRSRLQLQGQIDLDWIPRSSNHLLQDTLLNLLETGCLQIRNGNNDRLTSQRWAGVRIKGENGY